VVNRTQGQSAGLTRDRIAAAAVDLVDRDGLERFGVRRLATAMGVDPMSIYHHVKGKMALLDAISAAVLAEAEAEIAATGTPGPWDDTARRLARAYRDLARRHPRVFPLLTTRAQTSPLALAAIERLSDAMRRDGFPDRAIADAPLTLFAFLNGYLLATLSTSPDETPVTPSFDAAKYPTMASLAPLQADFGSQEEFDRTLETVLAGIGTAGRRAGAGEAE
jgi:AcrR family transcriptional regulator